MMNCNQLQRVCVSRHRVNKVRRVLRRADVSVATLLPEGDGCDCSPPPRQCFEFLMKTRGGTERAAQWAAAA